MHHPKAPHVEGASRWHRAACCGTSLITRRIPSHTARAIRGHRACTAFIEDFGSPEVQSDWRRSRYLPLRESGL